MMTVVSDNRLKKDIKMIRKHPKKSNINLYEWEWNGVAKELYGLEGKGVGCMPDEIEVEYPEAINYDENGYKVIDINKYPEDLRFKMMCMIEVENLKNLTKRKNSCN